MRPAARTRLAVALVAATTLAPVGATATDLDTVVRERETVEAALTDATQRLEELEAAVVALEDELAGLVDREAALAGQLADARDALTVRARSVYKRGGELSTFAAMMTSGGPDEALDRAGMLEVLSSRDRGSVEEAVVLTDQLDQVRALAERRRAELAAAEAAAAEEADLLADRLAGVQALERDVRERAARQRQIARGAQRGTYACILARPYSFVDSWGYPRSGGRSHEGTDVMSPMGNDVYAFTDGRVSRMKTGGLGGIVLYLHGDDGHEYYYAHLQGYADGIGVGTRVEAGQLIAYNGDSGNARGGSPHVHFEVHPGGGAPVNPYPWLTAVC